MENEAQAAAKSVCVACGEEFAGDITVCPKDGTPLTRLQTGQGMIGRVLGERYEILSLLGDGAMGQVYQARHKLLKRTVAVKMLHQNLVAGASALKRFQKEAELASALNHPNILTVHDFGVTDEGYPYLVMAYLEGKSLADVTAGGKNLELKRALHIFKQVCLGLGHAHEHGVVHRDLKPSNVMLVKLDEDPDFVKIVDFGIAKLLAPGESTDNLTRTGEVFGSPPYMSPEQCRAKEVDARSDIYSMGCLMYRTVSGVQPISGNDLIEYLYKHVNETPAPFSVVAPELNIPAAMEEIIFKAMAKAPEDRFQSMAELKAAIEPIYSELPGAALTSTEIPRLIMEGETASKNSIAGGTISRTVSNPEPSSAKQEALEKTVSDSEDQSDGQSGTSDTVVAQSGGDTASATAPGDTKTDMITQRKNIPLASTSTNGPVHRGLKQKLQISAVGVILLGVIASALIFKGKESPIEREIDKLQDEARKEYNQGNYTPAKLKIREAMKLTDKVRSPKSAVNHHLLGLMQFAMGSYDDAQANLESALGGYQKDFPDRHGDIADCESYLGRAATALGEFNQAEESLKKSLDDREKYLGKDALPVADSLTGLAYLSMRQKKIKSAEEYLTRALAITEKHKGESSAETAAALNNLGQAEQLAGKFKEAESLYRRGLTIRLSALDNNSPFLADSYNCIGAVCASTGRLKEAKEYYQKALAILEKSLSPSDPRLTQTQKQYADVVLQLHQ